MKLEFHRDGSSGTILVSGTLNLHSLKEFDQQLKGFDLSGLSTMALNLEGLVHTDSSGISGIIHLHKYLSSQNIFLKIGPVSKRVDRLFEQMRLYDIITRA